MCIAVTAQPPSRIGFIDRALIMAQKNDLKALIVHTKSDLAESAFFAQNLEQDYASSHEVIALSAHSGFGVQQFIERL
jgi:putative ribosome biogenesis GTPase RsgA